MKVSCLWKLNKKSPGTFSNNYFAYCLSQSFSGDLVSIDLFQKLRPDGQSRYFIKSIFSDVPGWLYGRDL